MSAPLHSSHRRYADHYDDDEDGYAGEYSSQPAVSQPRGSFREVAAALKERAAQGLEPPSPAPAKSASAALVKLKSQQRARRAQSARPARSEAASADDASLSLGYARSAAAAAAASPVTPSYVPSVASLAADPTHPLAPSPDVKPLPLYSLSDVENELLQAASILRDTTTSSWVDRTACMRRLQSMLLGGVQHFDNFLPLLRSQLREALGVQVLDLRSSVVREACVLLCLLGRCLGDGFEPFVVTLLPQLFKLLPASIQIIRESANECIRTLLQSSASRSNKIVARIFEGSAAANGTLRLRCMEYVLLLLELSNSVLLADTPALQSCLLARLADKNEEVRHKARQCVCAWWSAAPASSSSLVSSWVDKALDTKTAKLVREERARYELMRFPEGRDTAAATTMQTQQQKQMPAATEAPLPAAAARSQRRATGSWEREHVDEPSAAPSLQHMRDMARSGAVRGSSGPVRATHHHSNSISEESYAVKSTRAAALAAVAAAASAAATPHHRRSKTTGAPASTSLQRSSSLSRTAAAAFDVDFSDTTQAAATATAALSSSTRLPARGRSRASMPPSSAGAGLAQSTRSASSVRGGATPAAAATMTQPLGFATPSSSSSAAATPAPAHTRTRSASTVRSSGGSIHGTPNLAATSVLALAGALPLSPSQVIHGHARHHSTSTHSAAASSSSSSGHGSVRRDLLDVPPLTHSQRSQLLQSLMDQSADSLWSKRVHAFEQLALIFKGGGGAGGGDATTAAPAKKVPEIFLLLDKLTLVIRAGLADVHHRVVSQALLASFALLTPLPSPQCASHLSECDLKPVLEKLFPDIFALLSHGKLPLREQANQLLNHLTRHFAPELLGGTLVFKSLDAVHAAAATSTHPTKIRLAMLEYLHYLLPISNQLFRTLTPIAEGGGAGGGGGLLGAVGQQQQPMLVNVPLRALLSRLAPLLSSSVDASSSASKEPQLKRMCIQLCQSLYLGFPDSFFASLACLPVPTNRSIRKHLLDSMPDMEARIAENNANQQQQQQHQQAQQQQSDADIAGMPSDAMSHGVGRADASSMNATSRTLDFSGASQPNTVPPTPHQAPMETEAVSADEYAEQQQQQQEQYQQWPQQPLQQPARPAASSHLLPRAQPQRERAYSMHVAADDYGAADDDAWASGGAHAADGFAHHHQHHQRMRSQSLPRDVSVSPDHGVEADVEGANEESGAAGSSFSAAYIDSLLEGASVHNADLSSRQSAFTQLLSYACASSTQWQPYFERVLLALLDVATNDAETHLGNGSAPLSSDAPGTMVAASLGVIEALLQNHSDLFEAHDGSGNGSGGDRYLELVLRSMLQVLRSIPVSTSSSGQLVSPRSHSAQAVQAQAVSVFTLASNLSPPSLLLRLLLHVLSSEQVHEGVLKLSLQRLARLIDERLDGATLMGSPDAFGMDTADASASTLLSLVVHSLSLCTHSSVLVRKLVITAFVRLYARVEGLLLPALDGLSPLLVKLIHIYIEKYEATQRR